MEFIAKLKAEIKAEVIVELKAQLKAEILAEMLAKAMAAAPAKPAAAPAMPAAPAKKEAPKKETLVVTFSKSADWSKLESDQQNMSRFEAWYEAHADRYNAPRHAFNSLVKYEKYITISSDGIKTASRSWKL